MPKPENHEMRINITDSIITIVDCLSEGYWAATNVLLELYGSRKDGSDFLGGFGSLLLLDHYGVYSSNIYILFKECCNRSVPNVATVLAATQLGAIDQAALWNHIDNRIEFNMTLIKAGMRNISKDIEFT